MTTPLDAGLSDIEIQTWLDDNLNSHLLGYFVHGKASKLSIFEHVLTSNEQGIYTGLFAMAIWQLLGMN